MSLVKTNYAHVAGSTYIVRTQAGFRNALKHRFDNWRTLRIITYPKVYPSLITLDADDCGRVYSNPIHLNVVKDAISRSEAAANFQHQMG